MAATERFWAPDRLDESHTDIGATTYLCDANGEYCAIIGKVPKSGTLTRFEFNLRALANAVDNGIRCSFQDVNTTTGLPDGTPDQSATIASGAQSAGWTNPGDFSGTRTVTAGDVICCVIENPSFTASDSFAVGSYTFTSTQGLPYAVNGTGTKQGTSMPIVVLRYDDGTYECLFGAEYWPVSTVTNLSYQADTTPDEAGMAFTVDLGYTLSGIACRIAPSAGASVTYVLNVYDSGGSVLSTQTLDNDIGSSPSAVRYFHFPLTSPLTLTAGALYRVTLSPVSTTSGLALYYGGFASAALMDVIEFGSDWYMTTRTNAGSWTDYNNSSDGFRRPHIHLNLTPPTSGVGGGGKRPFRVTRQ